MTVDKKGYCVCTICILHYVSCNFKFSRLLVVGDSDSIVQGQGSYSVVVVLTQ